MIESLSQVLVANGLNPDSFTDSDGNEKIFRGEPPAGRVVETWMKLAKAASETKCWPIIRGALDDSHEPVECDADAVLAAVPAGSVREILQPRMEERRESLAEMMPEFAQAIDMDELARLADAAGTICLVQVLTSPGRPRLLTALQNNQPELINFRTQKHYREKLGIADQ